MSKKIFLASTAVLVLMLTASLAGAWGLEKIKCKNPEAQKLADKTYEILVADVTKESYKKANELLEKAVAIEPDNDMLLVELASGYWEYADQLPKETREQKKLRLAWFDKGKAAAEKALAIKKTAGAHFWFAVNLAAGGEMKGIMQSLWMYPKMVKHSKKSEALDPEYLFGATSRFWSEVVTRVPDLALRLVGMNPLIPLRKIEEQMKKNPLFLENYNFAARYYARMKKKGKALDTLEFVLKTNPRSAANKAWHSSNVYAQSEAREMWKEFTGKNYPER